MSPPKSDRYAYGSIVERPVVSQQHPHEDDDSDDDDDEDHFERDEQLRKRLLQKIEAFTLPYDSQKAYRATELEFLSFSRPHMRTFHASWICFFCSWWVWFSMAPLLPHIRKSTGVTVSEIYLTNMWSMVGTIVLRLLLGPLCDQYGARRMLTGLLAACAVPLLVAGIFIHDYYSLLFIRFWIGCVGGTLVPAQYWITSMFAREVCGRAMAFCAGWGAMGGGFAQLVMGTLIFPTLQKVLHHNDDLAWRVALVVPASIALGVAYFFRHYSDDCPLGNYAQLQRAGLMQERSAIDSFRSGAVNLNAWILFVQFGASLGIELTMESSATLHLADRFDLDFATAAAYASLFGIMNIFSRGLGGILSDQFHQWYSLKGRFVIHMVFMIVEGILIFVFAQCDNLYSTMFSMVLFAIFGQMSMGTCFGIIPYVDGPNTGTIAGIVGAGGNVGAILFLNVFKSRGDTAAFEFMAVFCLAASCLTPLIVIKNYRGILFGKETKQASGTPLLITISGNGSAGVPPL